MKKNLYAHDEKYRIKQRNCSDYNTQNAFCFKMTLFSIKNYIKEVDNYLDIGCQEGQFASLLDKSIKINNVYCNDINKITIDEGKKKYPKFNWIHSNIEEANISVKFNLITSLNIIYQLFTIKNIKKIYNLLHKNGYFVILYGDVNFEVKNITYDDILVLFKKVGFKIINTVKTYENKSIETDAHLMANRWYSCLILQK